MKTLKMRSIILYVFAIFLLFGIYTFHLGQSDSTNTEIIKLELVGGSVLIGTIVFEDSTSITISLLSNNETTIQKNAILERTNVSPNIKEGEYWLDDPNSTRLFFAPTGRGLKTGQGYFAAYEVLFPMIAYGINDYITLAGGISLLPGAEVQLLYFAPKVNVLSTQNFDLSVGWLYVGLIGESNSDPLPFNLLYTVGTYTFDENALTGGLGIDVKSGKAMLMIGGELRVSQTAKLLTENWFFNGGEVNFISFGVRFFGKSLAADFGFILPFIKDEDTVFIPWLGFAYNF